MQVYLNEDGTKKLAAQSIMTYTAVAADASANTVDITVDDVTNIEWVHVEIFRSDVQVTADADISFSGSTVTVADGAATYAITAGDKIYIHAVGGND